jgi:N utilization substance protein B
MATKTNFTIRRRARECALQVLYQMDVSGHSAEDALAAYWQHFESPKDVQDYAGDLVRGVETQRAGIDTRIQGASHHWKLDRMAKVDRNVLRLAVYELLFRDDIPKRVSLNEAIEIAKRFGTEDSGKFINGILDQISSSVTKD